MKIDCIIIDDELLARKGLSNFINEVPFLNLKGTFQHPVEALPVLNELNIKLVFLDIQMPKMTGLEFLKTLSSPPATIITTAFPNYALESFELNVLDYLVKPIPFERFVKAVNKAKDYLELLELKNGVTEDIAGNADYFFIRTDSRYEKILYNELLFVEARHNYVVLNTGSHKYISYLTFKTVEEYLPAARFLRVHKSYIISIARIDSIEGSEIKIGNYKIPISRANKEEILDVIFKNKLLKR